MKCNLPNRKSGNETPEEEAEFRQSMGDSIAKIMKVMLRLLKPLVGDLPDYRDQRRVTYPKESLFLYGVMMFAMLAETRREANRFMTEPFMQANLKAVIDELLHRCQRDHGLAQSTREKKPAGVMLQQELLRIPLIPVRLI